MQQNQGFGGGSWWAPNLSGFTISPSLPAKETLILLGFSFFLCHVFSNLGHNMGHRRGHIAKHCHNIAIRAGYQTVGNTSEKT